MAYKDPEKQKEAQRQSYLRNKDKVSESRKRRRSERQQFVDEIKLDKGCSKCGYSKASAALDFHHTNGDKDKCVSRLILDCRSFEIIQKEIDKCTLLCANCHREHHAAIV